MYSLVFGLRVNPVMVVGRGFVESLPVAVVGLGTLRLLFVEMTWGVT
jgi:hypothetical protein